MRVVELSRDQTAEHVHALEGFESGFSYPLGASERFSIRHGADYGRFFRAIGDSVSFIALDRDCVIGAISVALRPLLLPDGRLTQAAYLGDLKVLPSARGGPVMYRLVRHAASWAQARSERAFAVVMDGTTPTPDSYTGRAGLPRLERLASVCVVRLPLTVQRDLKTPGIESDMAANAMTYQSLSLGRYATPAYAPQLRSRVAPQLLQSADGASCGMLEDTREAKRLFVLGGSEMVSAHLSHFAYRSVPNGADLLRTAMARAAELLFPALFFAVTETDAEPLLRALQVDGAAISRATVYGHGFTDRAAWNLNTSEI